MSGESCLSCGAALSPLARYCRHCGAARGAAPHGPPQAQGPGGVAAPAYAPEPAAPAGRDRVLVVVAATVGLLAVAGVAVALALASGSGGHASLAASPAAVAVGVPQGAAQESSQREAEPPAATGPAGPVAVAATTYVGARITASVPPDWMLEEDEGHHSGYVESRWRATDGSSAYMLVDASPATHLTPAQDAAPVHGALISESGYSEVYYGSGDLAVPSWEWIFQVSGDERIDYFFERCGLTFGVLGSSPAAGFAQRRAVYRAFADSVGRSCA
jgi:hypothetical protein